MEIMTELHVEISGVCSMTSNKRQTYMLISQYLHFQRILVALHVCPLHQDCEYRVDDGTFAGSVWNI
jgi:hypothetical protein